MKQPPEFTALIEECRQLHPTLMTTEIILLMQLAWDRATEVAQKARKERS